MPVRSIRRIQRSPDERMQCADNSWSARPTADGTIRCTDLVPAWVAAAALMNTKRARLMQRLLSTMKFAACQSKVVFVALERTAT